MLSKILHFLVPDSEFSYTGEPSDAEEYTANVTWLDKRPQPTWADVEAARPAVENEVATNKAKQARLFAYRAEADPLYFGWQRGENTEQDWLNKVAEIRARYPYPA